MQHHPINLEVPIKDMKVVERKTGVGLVEKLISISPGDCAKALARMAYDSQREFFEVYSSEIAKQIESDRNKGRVQLPDYLSSVEKHSYKISHSLAKAWKVCSKYMAKTNGGYTGT